MFQQTGCFLSYLFSPLLKALLLPHPQLCSALQKLLPARSPESLGQGWDSLLGMGWIYPSQVWDGFTLGPAMVPPLPPLPDGEVFLCGGPSGCQGMLGHPLPPIAALGGHVFKNSTSRCPLYLPHREAQTLAKVHQSSLTIYVPSGGVGPPTLCPSICCSA